MGEKLTEEELITVRLEAVNILIVNHEVEFERIKKAREFNARQVKAGKKK